MQAGIDLDFYSVFLRATGTSLTAAVAFRFFLVVTERCDVEFENVCFELRIPRALNELIAILLRRLMVLTLVVLLLVFFVSLLIRIDLNGGRGGRLSLRDRSVPF